MSWQVENATRRIFNTFKRLKGQIFSQDIDALKTITEYISEMEQKRINDNILYAKLLCFVLYRNVEHFKDIRQSLKNIQQNVFDGSIEEHIEILKLHLNKNDFDEYLSTLGLTHEFLDCEEEFKNMEILKENEKEVVLKIKKFWEHDKVSKSFYKTANEFLNDVNNYK